jgi:hypothetical protein
VLAFQLPAGFETRAPFSQAIERTAAMQSSFAKALEGAPQAQWDAFNAWLDAQPQEPAR